MNFIRLVEGAALPQRNHFIIGETQSCPVEGDGRMEAEEKVSCFSADALFLPTVSRIKLLTANFHRAGERGKFH